jgi:hypothetical protein
MYPALRLLPAFGLARASVYRALAEAFTPAAARVAEPANGGRDSRRFACTGHFFALSPRLDQAADGVWRAT